MDCLFKEKLLIQLVCTYVYLHDDIPNILQPQISVKKEGPDLSRLRTVPQQMGLSCLGQTCKEN